MKKRPEIWIVGDEHASVLRGTFLKELPITKISYLDSEIEKLEKGISSRKNLAEVMKEGKSKNSLKKRIEVMEKNLNAYETARKQASELGYKEFKEYKKCLEEEIKKLKKETRKNPEKKSELSRKKGDLSIAEELLIVNKGKLTNQEKTRKSLFRRVRELNLLNSFIFKTKPDVYFSEYEKKPFEQDYVLAKKAEKNKIPVVFVDDHSLHKNHSETINRREGIMKNPKVRDENLNLKQIEEMNLKSDKFTDLRSEKMGENISEYILKNKSKKAVVLVGDSHAEDVRRKIKQRIPEAKIHIVGLGEQRALGTMLRPITFLKSKINHFVKEEKIKKRAKKLRNKRR